MFDVNVMLYILSVEAETSTAAVKLLQDWLKIAAKELPGLAFLVPPPSYTFTVKVSEGGHA